MKRLALMLLLLIAVVSSAILVAMPGAEASPATFTVDSTGDGGDFSTADGFCDTDDSVGDGPCTLRAAIEQANALAGTDTIEFDIPGAGPHTISPGSALPTITDPVIIDGTSEPDFAGTAVVELDGTNAGAGTDVDGLKITAGSSTVKGLVINSFGGDGIELSGSGGNTIEGNYIGTDVNGTADLGNSDRGVNILDAPSNTIGGTAAGAGNVISGNGAFGVCIWNVGATGNQVQGNYIGTDVTGTADLGNAGDGVIISNAPGNTIGGTAAGAGNVISGNNSYGVFIWEPGATGNQVQGNYIGTDATGTADLGNRLGGVVISSASSNTIGGTTEAARNVISGNDGAWGVEISIGATGNQVLGNYIGTDVTGTADLGNAGDGVWISLASASSNTIGGAASGAGNTIAYNAANGVRVDGAATSNTVSANSIHSNVGKGIENINGGNLELAPPTIDSVGSVSGHTEPKCYPCTVEVFSDDEDEGRIYHGSTATNDDATGTWTYAGAVTGPNITATITDASGNTSEFSAPVAYSPPVGGIAQLPDFSGSSGLDYVAIAGLAAPALIIMILSVSYARRRWLR